jgi:anti-sigma regulatory factor (Ser/Thr protein kinase)/tetratricopeptide (TPR) repeat protein
MRTNGYRRPILLFVLAVAFPGLVLMAFTLRMIRQEKELVRTRMAEEQQRIAQAAGQILLARLENLKIRWESISATVPNARDRDADLSSGLVLAAPIRGGELRLPWEDRTSKWNEAAGPQVDLSLIEAGERAEFREGNLRAAADSYRRAVRAGDSSPGSASARLSLARVLVKADRISEARNEYLTLLGYPLELSDEYGVPFAYFAAGCLLELEGGPEQVMARVSQDRIDDLWLPPIALSKLADMVKVLEGDGTLPKAGSELEKTNQALTRAIRRTNQALKLKTYFPTLAATLDEGTDDDRGRRWTVFGEDAWFVNIGGSNGSDRPDGSILLAVDVRRTWNDALAELRKTRPFPGECRLAFENTQGGLALNPAISGLRIEFEGGDPSEWVKSFFPSAAFYGLALLLILGVTGFGTYLLWRDMRRGYRSAELRSQFVSSVSHELKTPLTAIRMFAEALALRRPRAEAERADYLQTIVNESERLSRLINNVLDFSKIEQGTRNYRMEPVLLADVVAKAARTMAYPLERQGFRLHLSIEKGVPEIRGDSDALEQALLNLLHNAVKFSGDSREIGLHLRSREEGVAIEVEDHGIGISPDEREKVGTKYFRGDAAVNNRIAGAGLGLSIVNHIVAAHNGRLEIESSVGRGSVFSIVLPVESGAKAEKKS